MTSSAGDLGHGTRRKVRERLGTATGGTVPGRQEWPPKDPQTSLRPTLDYRAEGYLLFCRLRAALRHILFTGMTARTIALHLAPGDAPASVHTIIRELCAVLDVEFGVTLAQDVDQELDLTSQVPPLRHELHRHFAAVLVPSDVKLSAFLRAHCDAEIALLPASPRHIAALVHRTTRRQPTRDLVLALSGLSLEHLHLVFRDRRSYADLVQHVDRLQGLGASGRAPSEESSSETATKPEQERPTSPPTGFQHTVTLDDLYGMDEAVEWGKALVEDLKAWDAGGLRWTDIDPGILLAGPPGTGKTLFARALANSASVHFEATSTATWQAAGHLSDTLKAMRKCFDKAKAGAPAIVFVDELDAIGDRARLEGHNASYDRQVINAFLECLDGIGRREGVVVIAATNAPEQLDAAILRSGRLDRVIRIAAPDRAARAKILKLHLGNDARNQDFDDQVLDHLVGPLGSVLNQFFDLPWNGDSLRLFRREPWRTNFG